MAKDRLLEQGSICDHIEKELAKKAKMLMSMRQQENKARFYFAMIAALLQKF